MEFRIDKLVLNVQLGQRHRCNVNSSPLSGKHSSTLLALWRLTRSKAACRSAEHVPRVNVDLDSIAHLLSYGAYTAY